MRKHRAAYPFLYEKNLPYEDITSYFLDIFKERKPGDGYLVIRSGKCGHAEQSWIDVNKLSTNLRKELERHDLRDAYFSFATFKMCPNPRHSMQALRNIFAWSIDVDYKNEAVSPENMYEYIWENVEIPKPNFIECGHRLRLIYVFKEPLRLFPGQKEKLLKGFSYLQQIFTNRINEELGIEGSFGAESCPPTSFFRIPNSINSKDGSRIRIHAISEETYTLQELFEEYLLPKEFDKSGNRDTWYLTWKLNQCRTDNPSIHFNSKMLWLRRLETLKELQPICKHRKKMLYYAAIGYKETGKAKTTEELLEALFEFNSHFPIPLQKKEIISRFRTFCNHTYHVKDETIARELEVDRKYFSSLNRKDRDKERYSHIRQKQIQKGKAKFQKMEKRRTQIMELIKEHFSIPMIAEKLKVSISTIRRDLAFMALNNSSYVKSDLRKRVAGATSTLYAPSEAPKAAVSPSVPTPAKKTELKITIEALRLLKKKLRAAGGKEENRNCNFMQTVRAIISEAHQHVFKVHRARMPGSHNSLLHTGEKK